MEFIQELFRFLVVRRRIWLWPIILLMVAVGGLLVVAQGTAIGPFIYTIF